MRSPGAQGRSWGGPVHLKMTPGPPPGDSREAPETHPGPPRAALGPPGSPSGGHGVAQTAKTMILLKLSLISMNFLTP